MEKLRELWLDHPMKSLDRAVWWIEYVLRHNGTKHLRSPTVDISWIQYLLLDVILCVLLLTFLGVSLFVKFVKFVINLSCKKKEKQN